MSHSDQVLVIKFKFLRVQYNTSHCVAKYVFLLLAFFACCTSTFRVGHRFHLKAMSDFPKMCQSLGRNYRIANKEDLSVDFSWSQNASKASYNQSQLLLKSSMISSSSISVLLPDLSLSRKEVEMLEKKDAAVKDNEGMTDLDFFKEEMRRMLDKMA